MHNESEAQNLNKILKYKINTIENIIILTVRRQARISETFVWIFSEKNYTIWIIYSFLKFDSLFYL